MFIFGLSNNGMCDSFYQLDWIKESLNQQSTPLGVSVGFSHTTEDEVNGRYSLNMDVIILGVR